MERWDRKYTQYYQEGPFTKIDPSKMHSSGYNDGFNIVIRDLSTFERDYLKEKGYVDIEKYDIVNFST